MSVFDLMQSAKCKMSVSLRDNYLISAEGLNHCKLLIINC